MIEPKPLIMNGSPIYLEPVLDPQCRQIFLLCGIFYLVSVAGTYWLFKQWFESKLSQPDKPVLILTLLLNMYGMGSLLMIFSS